MTGLVSLFARIEPQQFQECFLSWVNAIVGELELNVIAIDGKTMKQSYDRNDQQKALHIVTAWSSFHQLALGQKKEIKNLMSWMSMNP
ncbi:ISAs1 family transposase [Microcoleus sp. B5-D4]|uniref:ISAs1 family transposase n=1 Tax=unclassified Microcoleus TaxID=2642155 RepID=UPI002FD4DD24